MIERTFASMNRLSQPIDEQRYQRVLSIIKWVFALLLIWPVSRAVSSTNDFDVFYGAGQRVAEGMSPYLKPYARGLWYYYSPFFAWVMSLFTYLPQNPVTTLPIPLGQAMLKALWGGLNLLLIVRVLGIVADEISGAGKTRAQLWFWGLLMAMSYRWLFMNILYGQMTILVLWGVAEAYRSKPVAEWRRWGGLALGINIKILPLFFYGLQFWRAVLSKKALEWRSMAWISAWLLALSLVPYLFVEVGFHNVLIKDWLDIINPAAKEHILEVGEGGFIDFGAIVTKYFTHLPIPKETSYEWANLSLKEVGLVTNGFRLLVIVLCSYWAIRLQSSKALVWSTAFVQMSVFLAVIPLAFPHQRDYSLLMQMPALAYWLWCELNGLVRSPVWLKAWALFALFWMGCLLFFEAFDFTYRIWMIDHRVQGAAGLLFWLAYQVFLNGQLRMAPRE